MEETLYWLELLDDAKVVSQGKLTELNRETSELIAMFVSMAKGVKGRQSRDQSRVVLPHPSASSLSYG